MTNMKRYERNEDGGSYHRQKPASITARDPRVSPVRRSTVTFEPTVRYEETIAPVLLGAVDPRKWHTRCLIVLIKSLAFSSVSEEPFENSNTVPKSKSRVERRYHRELKSSD